MGSTCRNFGFGSWQRRRSATVKLLHSIRIVSTPLLQVQGDAESKRGESPEIMNAAEGL